MSPKICGSQYASTTLYPNLEKIGKDYFSMYSQEYEFTAVHEAGHAVCVERFPSASLVSTPLPLLPLENPLSRTRGISFGYDELEERFDGIIAYESSDLSYEKLLFIALLLVLQARSAKPSHSFAKNC